MQDRFLAKFAELENGAFEVVAALERRAIKRSGRILDQSTLGKRAVEVVELMKYGESLGSRRPGNGRGDCQSDDCKNALLHKISFYFFRLYFRLESFLKKGPYQLLSKLAIA